MSKITDMKSAGIIQVRMDSTRFPSKAVQPILDKPLLWHVINRAKKIGIPIIIATSNRVIDNDIEKIAIESKVDCFRGSFEDVLDRYYQTAKKYELDFIYRITGDTPLLDPRLCKKIVEIFEKSKYDYVRSGDNVIGVGMEGITFHALKNAWTYSKNKEEREHVTMYIKNHPEKFQNYVVESEYNIGEYHWSVETPYDFEFVKNIFTELQDKETFFTEDILELFERKHNLKKIK